MAGKTQQHRKIEPAHPGKFLAEVVIPSTGRTNTEIAAPLGVSRQALYDITSGRRSVTPAMAVRLGTLFGNGPEIWLTMQQAYDLWHARKAVKWTLPRAPTGLPPESIEVGGCYVTVEGRVKRVTNILPDGRVQYEQRLSHGTKWKVGILDLQTFARGVERPVPCDWAPAGETP